MQLKFVELTLTVIMEVYNAPKTGKYRPEGNYGSWKEYWRDQKQMDYPAVCPKCRAALRKEDIDGAHVIELGHELNGLYITPIHHACNTERADTTFSVEDEHLLKIAMPRDYDMYLSMKLMESQKKGQSLFELLGQE